MTDDANQPLNPASLARSTADYGPVLGDGNRVLGAEQIMKQFVLDGPPPPHSSAGKAMFDPMATFAFHLAATSITTSLDHLRTVAQVVQTALIPAFALMSLLRTGHECALVAQWLLEPSITDDQRTARGVGAQISDYDERRKFEEAIRRPPPARGQLAVERLGALLRDASARGYAKPNAKGLSVAISPLPSTVDLFDRFETTTTRPGSWLYRYYSGFAHGKQWAVTLGGQRQGPSDQHGHTAARVDANDDAVIRMMTLATDAALRAVSSYAGLRGDSAPIS
jgi:hypothetical protein